MYSDEEHGRRDSNPQPAVLETAALPIELLPFFVVGICDLLGGRAFHSYYYFESTISAIRPAPTVLPPSRMAKRFAFSMATGVMSSTSIETLSPGITISTPSGSLTEPVTSVVRK